MKKNKLGLITLSILSLSLIACGNKTSSDVSKSSDDPVTTDNNKTDNKGSSADSNFISEDEATGGIVYTLDETNSYYIVTDYLSVEYDIVIPSTYQGIPVREIGEAAFRYATIDTLRLPSSIRKIGKEAFMGLSSDSKLTELVIPEGVEEIDDAAFMYCPSITDVQLPSTLKTIGSGVFHISFYIKKVKVASNSNYLTAVNNVLYSKDKKVLYFYPAGLNFTTYDLPSEVEEIADMAFYGNQVLTSINITKDSNLTTIGYRSLAAMSALTSLSLDKASKLTNLGGYCLSENSALLKVTFPESVTELSEYMLYKASSLQAVTFKGKYTTIPNGCFKDCNKLTTFTIPEGVTSIGDEAFAICNAMTTITVPDSVAEIGTGAFSGCYALTSFTVPSKVTVLKKDVFTACRSMEHIYFAGNNITEICDQAFSGCDVMTSLDLSNQPITKIGQCAFLRVSSLKEITLPATLETVGQYAFEYCSSLEKVKFGSKITSIGSFAFYSCGALDYVYLPKSIRSIGSCAFRTTMAVEGTVKLYFEADSFTNEDAEAGTNITNGTISYSKTEADFDNDSTATDSTDSGEENAQLCVRIFLKNLYHYYYP